MAIILGDTYAIPYQKFSYRDGIFVAEASTLGYTAARGGAEAMLHRIYDDACDVGIAIRGRHGLVRYYLESTDRGSEDEIAGWRFKPIPEDARKSSLVARTSVLVIND